MGSEGIQKVEKLDWISTVNSNTINIPAEFRKFLRGKKIYVVIHIYGEDDEK